MDSIITADTLFSPFVGHEGSIISFVMMMQQHDLSSTDVLLMYEQYIAALRETMQPAPESVPEPDLDGIPLQPGERVMRQPCPTCGRSVVGKQLCPRVSPHWRTQLACDACGWHALSVHMPGYLDAHGYTNNVEAG